MDPSPYAFMYCVEPMVNGYGELFKQEQGDNNVLLNVFITLNEYNLN